MCLGLNPAPGPISLAGTEVTSPRARGERTDLGSFPNHHHCFSTGGNPKSVTKLSWIHYFTPGLGAAPPDPSDHILMNKSSWRYRYALCCTHRHTHCICVFLCFFILCSCKLCPKSFPSQHQELRFAVSLQALHPFPYLSLPAREVSAYPFSP